MLGRIWSAFGRVVEAANAVADSLFSLAATFRQADVEIRERLLLEGREPAAPPILPGPIVVPSAPPEANGVVHPPAEPEPTPKGRRRAS